MGFRQKLKDNPWIGYVLAIAFIGLAVALFVSMGGVGQSAVAERAYFTVDDGQTTFVADRSLLAPFQHDGKEAVKAHVYTCDGGKNTFVAYLSRLDDKVKQQYEAELTKAKAENRPAPRAPMGFLIKKPGSKDWTSSMDPRKGTIMDVNCDGQIPEIVHP